MNERMTLTGVVGLLGAALFAVGCSDSVSPVLPEFDRAPTVVEVTGLGQIGTGSPSAGNDVQTFDFNVKSDLTGTLTYTDYSIPASLQVGPTLPGTGITAFRTSSSACSDPTKGAEFDGIGQVVGETELLNFTVAVCDDGPAGSGLDFFSFSAPSITYSKSGTLTSGDIAKSTGSASGSATSGVEVSGTGQIGTGSPTAGSNLQTFTFDVKSDLSGTLTYTDYSISGSLQVGPTFPGTGITAFRTSSTACSDPTKGAEFDGTGQVVGEAEQLNFTVAVCDNGPAESGLDFFSFSAPSISYSTSGMLTDGDIVKSTTSSPATGQITATTTTRGTNLPSGYTVTVDGTTSQSIGINSSVTFTAVTATSHTVALGGLPTNCSVSGGTSRTVTVPSGGTATVSYSVTCATPNQPPTVNAGSDQTVLLGILYSETASFSDPNNDGPWSYTINWGDGSSTSGSTSSQGTISASHSYLLGSFTIRVTVTDSHGASGSDAKVLTVITGLPGLPGL